MKIIGGKFKGRRLFTPKNKDIRPTGDKIRGAIFNMLQSRDALDDARVLDAFCGTGALGLEALSRGAKCCTFIDKERSALDLARENTQIPDIAGNCDFILKDITKIKHSPDSYDLIFLDPPYNKGLIHITLEILLTGNWLAPESWIICESEKYYNYTSLKNLVFDSEKIYGDTKITLLYFNKKGHDN